MKFLKRIFNLSDLHPLVRNNYFGRMVNSTIAIITAITLLSQQKAELRYYIWCISIGLSWPHIAYLIVRLSRNQKWFEQYININLDAYIFGIWIPKFEFNPLVTIFFIANIGAGAIQNGGMKFLIIRLSCLVASFMTGTAIFGFRYNPESSIPTIIIIGLSIIVTNFAASFIFFNAYLQLNFTRKKLKEQKTRMEQLSSKLSKYLSPQIYDSIFTGKKDVCIDTTRKKLTIFFSDIKDFTLTTDSMEAEDLSSLLNSYLNEMSLIALKHGGTIDKYIGDAILIFFGDPDSRGEKEDALRCIFMSIEMRDRMKVLRENWRKTGVIHPLHIRIGVNTGFCTVGNFGSDERLDYTVIGGQVNLASRLESCAEPDQILISYDTYLLVKDVIFCREMQELTVKGISRPVKTFQVIDLYENLSESTYLLKKERDGISVVIDLTRADTADAAELLRDVLKRLSGDGHGD